MNLKERGITIGDLLLFIIISSLMFFIISHSKQNNSSKLINDLILSNKNQYLNIARNNQS